LVALCVAVTRGVGRRATIERRRVSIDSPGEITEFGADEIFASRGQQAVEEQ
jgi:hypothetical protein